jgi:hypothetical protein
MPLFALIDSFLHFSGLVHSYWIFFFLSHQSIDRLLCVAWPSTSSPPPIFFFFIDFLLFISSVHRSPSLCCLAFYIFSPFLPPEADCSVFLSHILSLSPKCISYSIFPYLMTEDTIITQSRFAGKFEEPQGARGCL